jgi:hypothetical protein
VVVVVVVVGYTQGGGGRGGGCPGVSLQLCILGFATQQLGAA